MTHKDILRMAREAGLCDEDGRDDNSICMIASIKRFAALVAAEVAKCGGCGKSSAEGWALYCVRCCECSIVAAAVAEEREAIISKIESEICHAEINNVRLAPMFGQQHGPLAVRVDSLAAVVDAIRARGEEPKRHPGYIIGDHWLQAAYTRVCTGETEDEVMTDYGWQRESR